MNPIRCIVLEDEEPAQNLLRHYFERLPDLELIEVFGNDLDASDFLEHDRQLFWATIRLNESQTRFYQESWFSGDKKPINK